MNPMRSPEHRQSKLNTIILSCLTGVTALLVAILAWIGNVALIDLKTNTLAVVEIRSDMKSVSARVTETEQHVNEVKIKFTEMVTKGEFNVEINELKKEIEVLRRKSAPPRP